MISPPDNTTSQDQATPPISVPPDPTTSSSIADSKSEVVCADTGLPSPTILPNNGATAAVQESSPKKGNPAKALQQLANSVNVVSQRFDDLSDFVRICKDKLLHEADAYRHEGAEPLIQILMHLHDLVFRQVQCMESGHDKPDPFVTNLLHTLEAEVGNVRINVIRPSPGDLMDLSVMKAISFEPCPFWRTPERIARVHSCGFARTPDGVLTVLRKAEISIYRHQNIKP